MIDSHPFAHSSLNLKACYLELPVSLTAQMYDNVFVFFFSLYGVLLFSGNFPFPSLCYHSRTLPCPQCITQLHRCVSGAMASSWLIFERGRHGGQVSSLAFMETREASIHRAVHNGGNIPACLTCGPASLHSSPALPLFLRFIDIHTHIHTHKHTHTQNYQ